MISAQIFDDAHQALDPPSVAGGLTVFIFDDAWPAGPSSEADNFSRTCVLDLIARLATEYDLDRASSD